MTTPRGGLVYGMIFNENGTAADARAVVDAHVVGCTVVVVSEANCYTFDKLAGEPLIPYIRRRFPNCKVGLEVSSWGGWRKPSVYYPLRTALGSAARVNDWLMRYDDGTALEIEIPDPNLPREKWQALQLVDFTIDAAVTWYVDRLVALVRKHQPDFLFWDEWHITLGFLPTPLRIKLRHLTFGSYTFTRDAAHRRSMVRLIRGVHERVKPIMAMTNGTGRTSDAPNYIHWCYSQNSAGAGYLGACAKAADHAIWYDDGMVFEHPANDAGTAADLARLVSVYGGCAQMNPGGRFDRPIPEFPSVEDGS